MKNFLLKSCVVILLLISKPVYSWVDCELNNSQWLSAADSASLDIDGNTMSFSVWVKPDGTQSTQPTGIIIEKMPSTDDTAYRLLFLAGTYDDFRFRINTSDGSVNCDTTGVTFSASTWHHVAGRYDGADMFVYFDGVLETTCSQTGNISTNNNDFYVCTESDEDGPYWDGGVNDLAIWNTDIGAVAVLGLFNSKGKRMFLQSDSSGQVACWALDDLPDGTAVDTSTFADICGNGNILTGSGVGAGGTAKAEEVLTYP